MGRDEETTFHVLLESINTGVGESKLDWLIVNVEMAVREIIGSSTVAELRDVSKSLP